MCAAFIDPLTFTQPHFWEADQNLFPHLKSAVSMYNSASLVGSAGCVNEQFECLCMASSLEGPLDYFSWGSVSKIKWKATASTSFLVE